MGREWRVVHNKQEKQAALPAILRQALLQAMSPRSTQQTTQSVEARFMPSWRTLKMSFDVPLCRRSVALWCSTTPCTWSLGIFLKSPTRLDRAKRFFLFFFMISEMISKHSRRRVNFGLGRIHPNGCMFELFFLNSNLKHNPSKN